MPKNMPEVEIDRFIGTPQEFRFVKHARRHDGVRGVVVAHGLGQSRTETFLDYTQAVALHEALGEALAFLDAD